MSSPRLAAGAAAHLLALLLGGLVGLGALAVHRSALPLGLALALATSFAVPWRLLLSRGPRTAASYAVGWLVVFAVALGGRPEGDFVVASDVEGYCLIAGAVVVLGFGVVGMLRQHPD